ncbi:hypothetical protein GCM10022289_01670 [Pedobacter jeongneungensis]|uniref:Uncharacterized protein n=1 Tax=Pedobacter jeongneungensis TaxID=947309 RepID=A0ABP8B250_9SPHI
MPGWALAEKKTESKKKAADAAFERNEKNLMSLIRNSPGMFDEVIFGKREKLFETNAST